MIVSLDVTREEVHDGSKLKILVDRAMENNSVKRIRICLPIYSFYRICFLSWLSEIVEAGVIRS
jgi:hypothetical protein